MAGIIDRVRAAGVVGGGGAGFPTWRKLDCQGRVDTLVLNGAECEPLLYADYYCLLHQGRKILDTAEHLRACLGAREVVVAVKGKRKAVVDHLRQLLPGYPSARLLELPDVYPSGDEQVLVHFACGRIVPQGGLPLDVGVLVQNVQTMVFIHDALEGRPVTRRFVTIGGAVAKPLTVEAPIGTSIQCLLEAAGGAACPDPRFLSGGAMMGSLVEASAPVHKTTSGVLVLPAGNPAVQERRQSLEICARISKSVCDQCFACTELCPRYLLGHDIFPHQLMRRAESILAEPLEIDHIARYCCECGVCSLIACPLKISPRRLIGAMKGLRALPGKKQKAAYATHPDIHRKRLPLDYLKQRLDLDRYTTPNVFLGPLHPVPEVEIGVRQFDGSPAGILVRTGQRVIEGERVAGGKWTDFHASVSGLVTATDGSVKIAPDRPY